MKALQHQTGGSCRLSLSGLLVFIHGPSSVVVIVGWPRNGGIGVLPRQGRGRLPMLADGMGQGDLEILRCQIQESGQDPLAGLSAGVEVKDVL